MVRNVFYCLLLIIVAKCIYMVDERTGEVSRLEEIESMYDTNDIKGLPELEDDGYSMVESLTE